MIDTNTPQKSQTYDNNIEESNEMDTLNLLGRKTGEWTYFYKKIDDIMKDHLIVYSEFEINNSINNFIELFITSDEGFKNDVKLSDEDTPNNQHTYMKFANKLNETINTFVYDRYIYNPNKEIDTFFTKKDLSHSIPSLDFTNLDIIDFVNRCYNLPISSIRDENYESIFNLYSQITRMLKHTISNEFVKEYYYLDNVNKNLIDNTGYEPFVYNFNSLLEILTNVIDLQLNNISDETYTCDKIFLGIKISEIIKYSTHYWSLLDYSHTTLDSISTLYEEIKESLPSIEQSFVEEFIVQLKSFLEVIPTYFKDSVFTLEEIHKIEGEYNKIEDIDDDMIQFTHSQYLLKALYNCGDVRNTTLLQRIFNSVFNFHSTDNDNLNTIVNHLSNIFTFMFSPQQETKDNAILWIIDYFFNHSNKVKDITISNNNVNFNSFTYIHTNFFTNLVEIEINDDDDEMNKFNSQINLIKDKSDKFNDMYKSSFERKSKLYKSSNIVDCVESYEEDIIYTLLSRVSKYFTSNSLIYIDCPIYDDLVIPNLSLNILNAINTLQANLTNEAICSVKELVMESKKLIDVFIPIYAINLIEYPSQHNLEVIKVHYGQQKLT